MLSRSESPVFEPRATRARYDAIVAAPFGGVGITVDGERVTGIRFLDRAGTAEPTSDIAQRAAEQIARYFADPRFIIDVPLTPTGTPFQRRVWDCITAIPPGVTRRYGELANELRSVARAVGQACGDNRYPLAIPCHRVVAASGAGGFAHQSGGFLLDVKHWLLRHEALVPLDAR